MQTSIAAQLGARIKSVRMAQKLTQEKLAERIGKSIGLIGQIERGEAMPSVDTLLDIIRALQVTPGSILGELVPEERRIYGEMLQVMAVLEEPQQQFLLDFAKNFADYLHKTK